MWSKKELIDKQARFWVLMAGGSTLTAACEAVGVNRVSGRRWRQATGGRIPRRIPEPSGRYLSLEERLQIADLYLGGVGVRAIAIEIVQGVFLGQLRFHCLPFGVGKRAIVNQDLGDLPVEEALRITGDEAANPQLV